MHTRFIFILTAAAAACSLQVPAAAQDAQQRTAAPHATQAPRQASRAPGQADRQFMRTAAHAGHLEVIAGQMAVARGHDPSVREFGRRLIRDHTQANRKLDRIAMNFGVRLPSRPDAQQMDLVHRLQGLGGAEFDRVFMEQVGVQSHQRAVDLFRQEASASAADPALQRFARKTLPALEQHLRMAQETQASLGATQRSAQRGASAATHAQGAAARRSAGDELRDARDEVREAVQVVHNMKADPRMTRLLQQAHGVFILPDYGRAALGLGVQGGQGVLVTRNGNDFGNPVFYNMGGISVGPQAGAAAGQLALLLMTDRAVQQFRSGGTFSINADAGLTLANYSARGQVSGGKVSDVIVWSDTEGAYAGLSAGLTGITFDQEANRAYYGRRDADPNAILSGKLENPNNNVLGRVLGI